MTALPAIGLIVDAGPVGCEMEAGSPLWEQVDLRVRADGYSTCLWHAAASAFPLLETRQTLSLNFRTHFGTTLSHIYISKFGDFVAMF